MLWLISKGQCLRHSSTKVHPEYILQTRVHLLCVKHPAFVVKKVPIQTVPSAPSSSTSREPAWNLVAFSHSQRRKVSLFKRPETSAQKESTKPRSPFVGQLPCSPRYSVPNYLRILGFWLGLFAFLGLSLASAAGASAFYPPQAPWMKTWLLTW